RFEYTRHDFRRHAAAGVRYGDHHIVADLRIAVDFDITAVDLDILEVYDDPAALRHGVARIDDQIDDRRLQLCRIDHRGPQRVIEAAELELHARTGGARAKRFHVLDEPANVRRFRLEHLAPSEGEQPLRQRGA